MESLLPGRFGIEKQTLTIPLDTGGIIMLITMFTSMVTLGSCLYKVLPILCGRSQATQPQAPPVQEHISVINTVPSPAISSSIAPIQSQLTNMYPQYIPCTFAKALEPEREQIGLPIYSDLRGNSSGHRDPRDGMYDVPSP